MQLIHCNQSRSQQSEPEAEPQPEPQAKAEPARTLLSLTFGEVTAELGHNVSSFTIGSMQIIENSQIPLTGLSSTVSESG